MKLNLVYGTYHTKKKMLQCLDFQRVDISRASERANTQLRTIEVQFVNSEPVYDKQKKGLRDKNEKQENIFVYIPYKQEYNNMSFMIITY